MLRLLQIGEALAEATNAGRGIGQGLVFALMRQATEERPYAITREKCFTCLAAFLQRLELLGLLGEYGSWIRKAENLLLSVLPYVKHTQLSQNTPFVWLWRFLKGFGLFNMGPAG